MVPLVVLGCLSLFYFLIQSLVTRTFEPTDANNYLYIATLLDQGQIVYKDIFLDNFPLAVYTAWFYKTITFGNMQAFFVTGSVEGVLITLLLYWILLTKTKNQFASLLGALTFFSSFIFLRTSTSQTGGYTALLFFSLGYLFFEKKQWFFCGVFAACAMLTKGYMLPLVLAVGIAILIKNKKDIIWFTVGGLLISIVVMLPTLLYAFPEFIYQTFHYGLIRQPAEDKGYIFQFLYIFDFTIIAWIISGWFLYKKDTTVWLLCILTPLFFVFYKDFYFIYFEMVALVAALSAGTWLARIKKPLAIYIIYSVVLTILLVRNGYTVVKELRDFHASFNLDTLISVLKKEDPDYIYSHAYISNGLSYITGIPPYGGYIDITPNQFTTKILDKTQITKEMMKTKTMIILFGTRRENRAMIIESSIIDNKVLTENKCKYIHKHAISTIRDATRYLLLVKCY